MHASQAQPRGELSGIYLQVKLVVQVPVNLLSITILPEQPSQHTKSSHPQNFGWQTGLTGSLPLTYSIEQAWPHGHMANMRATS